MFGEVCFYCLIGSNHRESPEKATLMRRKKRLHLVLRVFAVNPRSDDPRNSSRPGPRCQNRRLFLEATQNSCPRQSRHPKESITIGAQNQVELSLRPLLHSRASHYSRCWFISTTILKASLENLLFVFCSPDNPGSIGHNLNLRKWKYELSSSGNILHLAAQDTVLEVPGEYKKIIRLHCSCFSF